jgi:hypothetical protein
VSVNDSAAILILLLRDQLERAVDLLILVVAPRRERVGVLGRRERICAIFDRERFFSCFVVETKPAFADGDIRLLLVSSSSSLGCRSASGLVFKSDECRRGTWRSAVAEATNGDDFKCLRHFSLLRHGPLLMTRSFPIVMALS